MPDITERQKAVEERRTRVARLLEQRNWTNEELAEQLGVDERTIVRDRAALRAEGRLLERQAPSPEEQRNAFLQESAVNTYFEAQSAMRRLKATLDRLEAEMGHTGEPCRCCGRAPLVVEAEETVGGDALPHKKKRGTGQDPLKWNALFNGYNALSKQIELLARMLGQLDATTVVIRDADLAAMECISIIANIRDVVEQMEEHGQVVYLSNDDGTINVERVTRAVSARIFQALWGKNEARQRRTPGFQGIIDATYYLPGENPEG